MIKDVVAFLGQSGEWTMSAVGLHHTQWAAGAGQGHSQKVYVDRSLRRQFK